MHSQKHTCTRTCTHAHTHRVRPSSSKPMYCLSLSAPQGPGHNTLERQFMPSEPFACKLSSFWLGDLADVGNSPGSQQERVGFDWEQVQMVAVSPRCCMETNKPGEIGSSASAWPCRVEAGALLRVKPVWPLPQAEPGTRAW